MTKPAGRPGGKVFPLHVPFNEMMGIRVEHWERGRSLVTVEVRQDLTNSWKVAHGGVVTALLDVALATAAHTSFDEGEGVVTLNLSVSFLSAGRGALVAEGRLLRGGRSVAFCEGEVRSEEGEVVAKGVGTFKLRRRKEAAESRSG